VELLAAEMLNIQQTPSLFNFQGCRNVYWKPRSSVFCH